ncbi:Adaptin N terminal region family protein [Tritrichomonas foetus]|uniref:AP-1 complex subunit gamma n=1 Tax=Tritrichomonas foetus TaxID=1144522 RepID=A0A1J4KUX8_9EUKA|nr:Adaptin N terminal region family protein [Tritrichomonas foetus]|eukprot:OHT13540.1 Adaptin N terminal region family protein [Tritrichomonas foetus]
MSQSLESFIRNITLAPTIEEERIGIANEMANMRTFIRDCDPHYRPSIIAKLMFLTMRGENTSWGQMEVVTLMTHERFSYKRIGYLAATMLLDENNELVVLVTATVQRDLTSSNPLIQKLALALISNIGTPDMCEACAPTVAKIVLSSNAILQKYAGMAAVRIIRKCPETYDQFRPAVAPLLNQLHTLMIGIKLALEMLKIDQKLREPWQQFCVPFTRILHVLFEQRASSEYSFGVFNNPFLQISVLQCLQELKAPSDDLDDILSTLVTSLDVRRSTGRSILLQTVQTIGTCAKKPSLRSLAFNQIGRLFTYSESNILYSALSAFSRILYNENQMLDRSSSDSLVLQRYKSQVVHCLDHRDPSIRRRALDVVAALVDQTNIETLVPEIMSYLKMADGDFRSELVAKVFAAVQRFAPSPAWNFDTVLKLISDSGNYVGNDVITSFCKLIAHNLEIRSHVLAAMSEALSNPNDNQTLIQVAAWTLGEFQEEVGNTVDTMIELSKMPQTTVDSRCYLLTALAKLAPRFGQTDKVRAYFELLLKSNNLEIQQRAGEMYRVLSRPDVADQLLAPLEVDEVDTASPIEASQSNQQQSQQPAQQQQEEDSLLDLLSPSAPAAAGTQQQAPKDDLLGDLLELASPQANPAQTPSQPAQQQAPEPPKEAIKPPPNALEAQKSSDFTIYFEIQKNAQNPRQLAIRASVFNNTDVPLNNFLVQYGVPNGYAIQCAPPSGNYLAPIGGPPITQVMMLENRGNAPLKMLTQTTYMYRSQPLKEMGQINPIFS